MVCFRAFVNLEKLTAVQRILWLVLAYHSIFLCNLFFYSDFDIPEPSGPKHEDGLKEGCYRFSDLIGPPKDDVITPKKKIENKTGKMLQYLSPLTPEMPLFTLEIIDGGECSLINLTKKLSMCADPSVLYCNNQVVEVDNVCR